MSPARTSGDGIDLNKLVRQIVLDVALLRWAAGHGRGLAVINALMSARRVAEGSDLATLAFLGRHIGDARPDDTSPPDAA